LAEIVDLKDLCGWGVEPPGKDNLIKPRHLPIKSAAV
jgi:hypothetical protein